MPKSNKKSKSKSSIKQSQRQKQHIIVNVNSHNKRKSTHHHHKQSSAPPAHIVVPSTNHHMMFMPQPQGLPPANLLGDNNYGIGMNHRLDATLQRMNETIEQVQQDALNNSRQQDALNDLRRRRHQQQQQEEEPHYYNRNDYPTSSSRGAGGGRGRSHTVYNEEELLQPLESNDNLIYAEMNDIDIPSLTSAQRSVFSNYLDQTITANTTPLKAEAKESHPVESIQIDAKDINYDYQSPALTMGDLFSGSIQPLQFTAPKQYLPVDDARSAIMDHFKKNSGSFNDVKLTKLAFDDFDILDGIARNQNTFMDSKTISSMSGFGSPLVLNNTIEAHYLKPPLAIENSPSKLVKKIDDIQDITVENSDDIPIKVVQQSKEERANMRKAQQQRIKEEEAQKKEIAELQRIAKQQQKDDEKAKVEEELKQLRQQQNQKYQKASEIDLSKKFINPDEFINAYEELTRLTNGSSSSAITPEVLASYNKLRATFGKGHANRVVKMDPIIKFLQENNESYTILKRKHKPTTSIVPATRFGKGTIVKGSELLTSKATELPPIVGGGVGGGAVKILKGKN